MKNPMHDVDGESSDDEDKQTIIIDRSRVKYT